MEFHVYCRRKGSFWVLIASTRYKEDAEKVLTNWHEGYISHGGKIISTKNYDPNETTKENQ